MRVLIVDDGYHEDTIITEAKEYDKMDTFLQRMGEPHTEKYEILRMYVGNIEHCLEHNRGLSEKKSEMMSQYLFSDLNHGNSEDFIKAFNFVWNLITEPEL